MSLRLILNTVRPAGFALALITVFLLAQPSAKAQVAVGDTEFAIERFSLSMDRLGILDVEGAAVPKHLQLELSAWVGYANDPLVIYREEEGGGRSLLASLVHNRVGGSLLGSIGLWDRAAVGVKVPYILYQNEDLMGITSNANLSTAAIGDIWLVGRAQILNQKKHEVDLGVRLALSFPTASGSTYTGDTFLIGEPTLLVGRRFGKLRTLFNIGYRIRKHQDGAGLIVDDELFAKIGAAHPVGPVDVEAAFRTATGADDLYGRYNRNHNELTLGARKTFGSELIAFGAAGLGLTDAYGTPDFRIIAGVRLGKALGEKKAKKPVIGDRDGDGILDDVDECPDDPEDFDTFEDEDGCPDPDNDEDGVLDQDDMCINEPGVAENDGCPPEEVPEEPKKEPKKKEQPKDRDGDTVIDSEDNCPDEPGPVENQGCKKEQKVKITGGKLEILDIVYFQTNKAVILKKSFGLLNNVAEVLNAHSEIARIEVQGHTDSRGNDASNMSLSQRRAQSVVNYLVSKGVDAGRLVAKGYGETQPIASNSTNEGRSQNRRVEFLIKGAQIDQRKSGPDKDTMD